MTNTDANTIPLKFWQYVVAAPLYLFSLIGIILLALIWETTLIRLNSEEDAATREALLSSRQHAQVYEAHLNRALQEINQTLLFLQYAHEHDIDSDYFTDLAGRSLLPPALLFIVSIADRDGRIVHSNRPGSLEDISNSEYFNRQKQTSLLTVSKPQVLRENGPTYVHFSRQLSSPDGEFDGIAIVSAEIEYFVSSYDSNQLGENGLLAILDQGGVFLAKRVGDTISAGDTTDYSQIEFHDVSDDLIETVQFVNPWDGVERFTSAYELYQFPLAVIVGLSTEEQFANFYESRDRALFWAVVGSLVSIAILGLLGYQAQQLANARQHALNAERAHSAQVEDLALHDALTGLPNRILFSQLVSQSLHHARRYKHGLAVIFLDLDHFKDINDSLGHDAGDDMLKETASRLKACFRKSDTISRFGGDEFVALMPEIGSLEDAKRVGQKVVDAIAKPYLLKSKSCQITTSVGIALYPEDGEDEQTLTKHADSAMYAAKQGGRNTYLFWSQMNKK